MAKTMKPPCNLKFYKYTIFFNQYFHFLYILNIKIYNRVPKTNTLDVES